MGKRSQLQSDGKKPKQKEKGVVSRLLSVVRGTFGKTNVVANQKEKNEENRAEQSEEPKEPKEPKESKEQEEVEMNEMSGARKPEEVEIDQANKDSHDNENDGPVEEEKQEKDKEKEENKQESSDEQDLDYFVNALNGWEEDPKDQGKNQEQKQDNAASKLREREETLDEIFGEVSAPNGQKEKNKKIGLDSVDKAKSDNDKPVEKKEAEEREKEKQEKEKQEKEKQEQEKLKQKKQKEEEAEAEKQKEKEAEAEKQKEKEEKNTNPFLDEGVPLESEAREDTGKSPKTPFDESPEEVGAQVTGFGSPFYEIQKEKTLSDILVRLNKKEEELEQSNGSDYDKFVTSLSKNHTRAFQKFYGFKYEEKDKSQQPDKDKQSSEGRKKITINLKGKEDSVPYVDTIASRIKQAAESKTPTPECYGGIGCLVHQNEDGSIVIDEIYENSPMARLSEELRKKDIELKGLVIDKVDGEEIKDINQLIDKVRCDINGINKSLKISFKDKDGNKVEGLEGDSILVRGLIAKDEDEKMKQFGYCEELEKHLREDAVERYRYEQSLGKVSGNKRVDEAREVSDEETKSPDQSRQLSSSSLSELGSPAVLKESFSPRDPSLDLPRMPLSSVNGLDGSSENRPKGPVISYNDILAGCIDYKGIKYEDVVHGCVEQSSVNGYAESGLLADSSVTVSKAPTIPEPENAVLIDSTESPVRLDKVPKVSRLVSVNDQAQASLAQVSEAKVKAHENGEDGNSKKDKNGSTPGNDVGGQPPGKNLKKSSAVFIRGVEKGKVFPRDAFNSV